VEPDIKKCKKNCHRLYKKTNFAALIRDNNGLGNNLTGWMGPLIGDWIRIIIESAL
jgi:hypothetical protein